MRYTGIYSDRHYLSCSSAVRIRRETTSLRHEYLAGIHQPERGQGWGEVHVERLARHTDRGDQTGETVRLPVEHLGAVRSLMRSTALFYQLPFPFPPPPSPLPSSPPPGRAPGCHGHSPEGEA